MTAVLDTVIVGAGQVAQAHARALAASPHVRLAAVVEPDPVAREAFARRHGAPAAYADLDTLLTAMRPDLAHICSPPGVHADQAIACLDAGAWVMCEKPLCGGLAELDRIAAAERRSGARCAGVAQWRFSPRTQRLRDLIDRQAFGRPLAVSVETAWFRDEAYYAAPWRGRWESELGGPTVGVGIHLMDLALWLLGDWADVAALASTLDREIDVEDVSVAAVRFASGALATVVNSVLSPREESRLRIDFQYATVEFNALYSEAPGDWRLTARPGYEPLLSAWEREAGAGPSRMTRQFGRFASAALGEGDVEVSLDEVRPVLDLVSSLYKSAATGNVVRRGSIAPGDPFYARVSGDLGPGAFRP